MSSTNKQSSYATRSNGTVNSIFLCNEASCVKITPTTEHHQLNTIRETEHQLKKKCSVAIAAPFGLFVLRAKKDSTQLTMSELTNIFQKCIT